MTYLPRIPPFMDAKSYSGSISLLDLRLPFFIEPWFMTRCASGTDYPNRAAILGMDYHKNAATGGHANRYEAPLETGVAYIGKGG